MSRSLLVSHSHVAARPRLTCAPALSSRRTSYPITHPAGVYGPATSQLNPNLQILHGCPCASPMSLSVTCVPAMIQLFELVHAMPQTLFPCPCLSLCHMLISQTDITTYVYAHTRVHPPTPFVLPGLLVYTPHWAHVIVTPSESTYLYSRDILLHWLPLSILALQMEEFCEGDQWHSHHFPHLTVEFVDLVHTSISHLMKL